MSAYKESTYDRAGQNPNGNDYYPEWICNDCGIKHGRIKPKHLATWHYSGDYEDDVCGWCGSKGNLTEPRDFGWPEFKKK